MLLFLFYLWVTKQHISSSCCCFLQVMVDFFARVFCMRNQLFDIRQDREPSQVQSYVKNNKEKKHSEFKYDRVGCFEMQAEETWRNRANGGYHNPSGENESPLPTALATLEAEVKEIRRYLRQITDKQTDREYKQYLAREWQIVALVLDRLFFFVYLLAIFASGFTIFETTMVQTPPEDNPDP